GNKLSFLVLDADDVRQEDKLLGAQSRGQLSSAKIGVDVVDHTAFAQANWRHNRDVALVQRRGHRAQVHTLDSPHQAEVTVARVALALEQLAVKSADADSLAAEPLDHGHQLLLHFAHEHHLDHFHGLLVGHAQPFDRLGVLPNA